MPPAKKRKRPVKKKVPSIAKTDVTPQKEPTVPSVPVSTLPIKTNVPFGLSAGDTISLNLKRRFFLGVTGLVLNRDNWHAKIPANVSEATLKGLMIALESGDILKGEVYIPRFDPVHDTVDRIAQELDNIYNEIISMKLIGAMAYHTGLIEGHRVKSILTRLKEREIKEGGRPFILTQLDNAIEMVIANREFMKIPIVSLSVAELVKYSSELDRPVDKFTRRI